MKRHLAWRVYADLLQRKTCIRCHGDGYITGMKIVHDAKECKVCDGSGLRGGYRDAAKSFQQWIKEHFT